MHLHISTPSRSRFANDVLLQDKKAVDDYKAGIKEQLNRAGLIRGQPRPNLLGRNAPPSRTSAVGRPPMRHRVTAPDTTPSTNSSLGLMSNGGHRDPFFPSPIFGSPDTYGYPGMPGTSL